MKRAALILVAAVILAGCGRTAGKPTPSLVADFADAAANAGTFAFESVTTSTVPSFDGGEDEEVSMRMSGSFDLEREAGTFLFDNSEVYERFRDQVEASGSSNDFEPPPTIEGVFFDNTAYMRIDEQQRDRYREEGVPDSAKWLKMTGPREAFQSGGFDIFSPVGDPARFFELLQEVSRDVTEKGTADVRGVATTEYEVVVDVEKAAERVEGKKRREMYEELAATFPTLPMRIWIGQEDGLLYRHSFTLEVEGSRTSSTSDFFDYGKPIDVERPAEDEVYEYEPQTRSTTFTCTGDSSGGSTC